MNQGNEDLLGDIARAESHSKVELLMYEPRYLVVDYLQQTYSP